MSINSTCRLHLRCNATIKRARRAPYLVSAQATLVFLLFAVSSSVFTATVLAITFPNIPQSPDQARACLLRYFNSSTHRDRRVFSQAGEDGILECIYECIGVTNKQYVELGVENGDECTTRNLRENHGFQGLMIDGKYHRPEINLQKEMIFSYNIASLLEKYKVPKPSFDQLTIDIDQNTFWVAQAILHAGYRPRSLTVEFNQNFAWNDSYASIDMPNEIWDDTEDVKGKNADCYYGASAKAFRIMAKSYGYHLVSINNVGLNLFFVHESVVGNDIVFTLEDAKRLFGWNEEYIGIHGQCRRHVWLKVPEGTDFAAPNFSPIQLPKVLLGHKPGGYPAHKKGKQRVFYEIPVVTGLFHGVHVNDVRTSPMLLPSDSGQRLPRVWLPLRLWQLACIISVAFMAGVAAHSVYASKRRNAPKATFVLASHYKPRAR